MPSGFAIDYIVWVFVSTLGVVQAACALGGLRGLLFARAAPTRANVTAGLGVAFAMAVWYFLDERRNLPDTTLGLDANVQARWFVIAASAAIGLTFLATSAINHRWGRAHGWDPASGAPPPEGFGWLARTTFLRAIHARAVHVRRRGRDRDRA